jgi:hypothetical protein
LTIYPQQKYELQQEARQRQETESFKELYEERAGIEGIISLGVQKDGDAKIQIHRLATYASPTSSHSSSSKYLSAFRLARK